MKALVLHGPGDYRVEHDWPEPRPKPGWATVRVACAGVCGSDLPRFTTTGAYHHPIILGHEFAGAVAEPAPGSEAFRGGEPVAVLPLIPCGGCEACRHGEPFHCGSYQFLGSRNDGGLAEYCLVPEANLFRLPAGLDLRHGALIEPLAVGLHVARQSGLTAGQTALVFGAGPIGLLIGLWLRAFDARKVVMADLRSESLKIAQKMGFRERVDGSKDALESIGDVDHVFEAAGSREALLLAIEKTRDKGAITLIGRETRDTTIPLPNFEQLMRKELVLRGCWGYNMTGEHDLMRRMLAEERFPLDALITHEIALNEAPRMIRAMSRKELHYCKVLVRMS